MINEETLLEFANFKSISPRLAELDYLQDIALFNISREFGDKLVFKGGTCLYKVFQLNRFSEDLDFSATHKFAQRNFFHRLPYFFNLLGINSTVKVKKFENTVNVLLLVNGPLFDGSQDSQAKLLFNISSRERVLLPLERFTYRPIYRELRTFDLYAMNEKEILAEKIRSIYQRKKARDVFDLWYLLKVKKVLIEMAIVNKKLAGRAKFKLTEFLAKVEEKKASWQTDLAGLVAGELLPFAQVKKEIEESMK